MNKSFWNDLDISADQKRLFAPTSFQIARDERHIKFDDFSS